MQLFTFVTRKMQEIMSKVESVMRVEGGRTGLSRFLRTWYFDGLFCIVNLLWPVVIKWSEFHG